MENNTWLQKWDERYTNEEFVYGTDPNLYLQAQLKQLKPGSILFPADGEGRNSVYAALQGWESSAFDISTEGQKKALQFDAIALIYAHFPAEIKSSIHRMLNAYLRKGGFIIFEAFSKNHLDYIARNPNVGGPKDIESLFSIDEIKADFPGYDIVELTETEIELKEGLFHNGTGSVIRFVGRKQ
jgi:hypothetical protein